MDVQQQQTRNGIDESLSQLIATPPAQISQETITPKVAATYLARNHNIRTVSRPTVQQYARDMAAGNWHLTGDPISFDQQGRLVNGQHRLEACVQSGCSFTTAVIRGVSGDAVIAYDRGRQRTVGQVLHAINGVLYASHVAAMASRYRFRKAGHWTLHTGSEARTTADEIAGLVSKDQPRWERYAAAAQCTRPVHQMTPSVVGYLYMLAHEVWPELADEYFSAVMGREYFVDAHPTETRPTAADVGEIISRIRGSVGKLTHRENPAKEHQMEAWLIRGWNDLREDREDRAHPRKRRPAAYKRITQSTKDGRRIYAFPVMDQASPRV